MRDQRSITRENSALRRNLAELRATIERDRGGAALLAEQVGKLGADLARVTAERDQAISERDELCAQLAQVDKILPRSS